MLFRKMHFQILLPIPQRVLKQPPTPARQSQPRWRRAPAGAEAGEGLGRADDPAAGPKEWIEKKKMKKMDLK